MIGYGLPRYITLSGSIDCADILRFGLKSSISRVPRYGEIKNSFRSSKNKRATRRIWKKRARRISKRETRITEQEE